MIRLPSVPCAGLSPILSPRGLYAAAALGHDVDSHDYVSFAPIRDQVGDALAAGAFAFRGLRFVFSWTDPSLEPFIRHLGDSVPAFAGWQESNLLHPFKGINFNVGDRRAQTIKVVWSPFKLLRGRAKEMTMFAAHACPEYCRADGAWHPV